MAAPTKNAKPLQRMAAPTKNAKPLQKMAAPTKNAKPLPSLPLPAQKNTFCPTPEHQRYYPATPGAFPPLESFDDGFSEIETVERTLEGLRTSVLALFERREKHINVISPAIARHPPQPPSQSARTTPPQPVLSAPTASQGTGQSVAPTFSKEDDSPTDFYAIMAPNVKYHGYNEASLRRLRRHKPSISPVLRILDMHCRFSDVNEWWDWEMSYHGWPGPPVSRRYKDYKGLKGELKGAQEKLLQWTSSNSKRIETLKKEVREAKCRAEAGEELRMTSIIMDMESKRQSHPFIPTKSSAHAENLLSGDVKVVSKPAQLVQKVNSKPELPVKRVDSKPALPVKRVDSKPALRVKGVDSKPALPVKRVDSKPELPVKRVDSKPARRVEKTTLTPAKKKTSNFLIPPNKPQPPTMPKKPVTAVKKRLV